MYKSMKIIFQSFDELIIFIFFFIFNYMVKMFIFMTFAYEDRMWKKKKGYKL